MIETVRAKARILVVDDEPGMLRAVTRILERDHDVRGVTSPADALAAAETFDPDMAVIDIRMPEMNGFDLMRRLRLDREDLDVIMMTGNVAEPEANLIRAIDEGAFYFVQKPFDRRVLLTLVGRCLELRHLRAEERRHLQRMARELADARRFQRSSLPPASNKVYHASLHAHHDSCTELAGDLYDYAAAERGVVALIIADVSGHGASAAMMTGIVKTSFHAAHGERYEPLSVVGRVAAALEAFEASRFVTLVAGRLDTRTGRFDYVNAGHPPPLVHAPGGPLRLLDPTGPLISATFRDVPWESASAQMEPADRLLLYTDGLLEAAGRQGMFGKARLERAVTGCSGRGAALLGAIIDDVAGFVEHRPWEDDITLLTAHLHALKSKRA